MNKLLSYIRFLSSFILLISSTTLSQECDINFDYVNTGSNMIIMINQNAR